MLNMKKLLTKILTGFVKKTGDTMTGTLMVNPSSGNANVTVKSNSAQAILAANENTSGDHGIWSTSLGKWLIRGLTSNGKIYAGAVDVTNDAAARHTIGMRELGGAGTAGTNFTLKDGNTYLVITGHSVTPTLNGIWIVRTNNNTAFKIAGGGGVTITVTSKSVMNVKTVDGGTVNVYAILLTNATW